jgi:protease I
LLTARVLPGRKLTAWTTIQDDLNQVGGMTVVDEQVVVDSNLVTSRKPDDLDAFIKQSLSLLQKVPAGTRS